MSEQDSRGGWRRWPDEQPERIQLFDSRGKPAGEISDNILIIVEHPDSTRGDFVIVTAYYHFAEKTWIVVEWDDDAQGETGRDMELVVRYWMPLPDAPADVLTGAGRA